MPFLLDDKIPFFPSPYLADEEGLLAVGGNITPPFLEAAYRWGIFPWYSERMPVLWWSPAERPVFFPGEVKKSKSMRQWIRRHAGYRITMDRAMEEVLHHCATVPRKDGEGTWLNPQLQESILALHRRGKARSVEVWDDKGRLRGGLYGIHAGEDGRIFSGDSMFSLEPNTSKYALIWLVENATRLGYKLIDGQVVSGHLLRMGAKVLRRKEFLDKYVFGM